MSPSLRAEDKPTASPEAATAAEKANEANEANEAAEGEGAKQADSPQAAERPVFLVTEILVDEAVGIAPEAARDALTARFGRLRDKIEVRSIGELKTALDTAALAQMLGSAAGDVDLAKVASYVEVDRLVFGRIAEVGGVVDVQVRIFNARDAATELALARRLKADAPRQLVLTVLDGLADRLAGYVLDTYTDGAPSAAFEKLAARKIERPAPAPKASGASWSMLGVTGGVLAGVGIGAGALAGLTLGADGSAEAQDLALAILGTGAGVAVLGSGLIVVDGLVE